MNLENRSNASNSSGLLSEISSQGEECSPLRREEQTYRGPDSSLFPPLPLKAMRFSTWSHLPIVNRSISQKLELYSRPARFIPAVEQTFNPLRSPADLVLEPLNTLTQKELSELRSRYSNLSSDCLLIVHDSLKKQHAELVSMLEDFHVEALDDDNDKGWRYRADLRKSAQSVLRILSQDLNCQIAMHTIRPEGALYLRGTGIILTQQLLIDLPRYLTSDKITIGDKVFGKVTHENQESEEDFEWINFDVLEAPGPQEISESRMPVTLREYLVELMRFVKGAHTKISPEIADLLISKLLVSIEHTFDAPLMEKLLNLHKEDGKTIIMQVASDAKDDFRQVSITKDDHFNIVFERTVSFRKHLIDAPEVALETILGTRRFLFNLLNGELSGIEFKFVERGSGELLDDFVETKRNTMNHLTQTPRKVIRRMVGQFFRSKGKGGA